MIQKSSKRIQIECMNNQKKKTSAQKLEITNLKTETKGETKKSK